MVDSFNCFIDELSLLLMYYYSISRRNRDIFVEILTLTILISQINTNNRYNQYFDDIISHGFLHKNKIANQDIRGIKINRQYIYLPTLSVKHFERD